MDLKGEREEVRQKRITLFELWSRRRVLRINWTEYATNPTAAKIVEQEENGLVEQLQYTLTKLLTKQDHLQRINEGLGIAVR